MEDVKLVRCEVTGPCPIVDYGTNEDVHEGGIVELNPEYTRIDLLVECGLVKVLPAQKAKPDTKAKD